MPRDGSSTRRQPGKRARGAVSREVKDALLKYVGSAVPDTFLAALGIDLPRVVEVLPNEVPVLEVRPERPDLLLRLADGSIAHIEFQTTTSLDDLERFYEYHIAISKKFGCLVYSIVIYGPGIVWAPSLLEHGSATYQTRNIYLGERDGEALVARLRERASAGERWSAQEQVEAILLPLMGRKRPLPVLLAEVTEVSGVLAVAERAKLLGTMVGLAYNYLEAGLAEQLLEVLRKMNAFEELIADSILKGLTQGRAQGRAEGRVEGRVEGRAEGKQEAILEILGKRFGTVPPMLVESLAAVHDPERLTTLLDAALDAESLDAFARAVQAEPSRP